MNAIGDVLAGMVQKSLQNQEPDDYFDDEGFLCCGNCHERKQMDVTLPAVPSIGRDAKTIRVGCLCKCGQEKADAEKADRERREFEQRMDRLRRDGITDPAYLQYTFAQDDQRNPKVSDVCRRYVENWEEMKAQNIGILFYGDVGTGKSFLACAIANALLERLVSVSVTNFPRILNSLQGSFDRGAGSPASRKARGQVQKARGAYGADRRVAARRHPSRASRPSARRHGAEPPEPDPTAAREQLPVTRLYSTESW